MPALARPRAASGRSIRLSGSSKSLIVFGTVAEAESQREAAAALQRKLAARWANFTVPIKPDTEVSESTIKDVHILLVGRPATNRLTARLAKALPVGFGMASFKIAGETYAHPQTAVVAAGPSPLAADRSVVVFAGLSAGAPGPALAASRTAAAQCQGPPDGGRRPGSPARHSVFRRYARYRGRGHPPKGRVRRFTLRSKGSGKVARNCANSSGTSISDGPSRSSDSRTAAWSSSAAWTRRPGTPYAAAS